jgi:hypothetical protein
MAMRQWIAADTHKGLGDVVGSGHCMALVQVHHGMPHSSALRRGERVRDMVDPPRGLVIATFNDAGRYPNAMDGSSHICIFLEKRPEGLRVVDQYIPKPVGERTIRYKAGLGKPVDDGDAYFAVLTDDA